MRHTSAVVVLAMAATSCSGGDGGQAAPVAAETVTVTETVTAEPEPAETVTVTAEPAVAATTSEPAEPAAEPTTAEPAAAGGERFAVLETSAVVDEGLGDWQVHLAAIVGNGTGSWVEDVDVQIVATDADGQLLGTVNETHYNIAAPGQDLVFSGTLYLPEPPAQPVDVDVRIRDEGSTHRDPGFTHGQPDPVRTDVRDDDGSWVAELTNPMPFRVAESDLIVDEVYRDADGRLLGSDGILVTEQVGPGAAFIVDSDWSGGTIDTAPATVDLYVYFSGDADQLYSG